MSDTEMNTPADGETGTASFKEMLPTEVEFIMTCLMNANDGHLAIDTAKVATQLKFANPRSVTNKLSQIKKKYGLQIKSGGLKSSADSGDGSVPRTPNKGTPGKVTKTPRSTKATPASAKGRKSAAKKDVEMAEGEEDEEGGLTDDAPEPETPTKQKKAASKRTPAVRKTPVKRTPAKAKKAKSEEKVEEDEEMEEGDADLSVKETGEEVEPEGVAAE